MLQRMQDPFRSIRESCFQRGKKPGGGFPLGMSVRRARGADHREGQDFLHVLHMALRQVDQGPYHRNAGTAHGGTGMESTEPALMEEGKDQRFNGVIPVVAESQLVAFVFNAGVGQNGTAHLGAQGTGILFLPVFENDFTDLCFLNDIGDFQGIAQGRNFRIIRSAQTVVHGDGEQGEILMGKLPVQGEGVKKKEGIFPAGDADGDFVPVFNQTEIGVRLPDAAKGFFHQIIPP